MDLKVVKDYADKYSKELVRAGTVLQGVPDGRAEELIAAGVAEQAAPEPGQEPAADEAPEDARQLHRKKKAAEKEPVKESE
jgi:hypothetical protein